MQNIKLHRPEKDPGSLLRAAGFRDATPLQEQYLAHAYLGRDLIVESVEGEGKTIAQLLPFISSGKPGKRGTRAIILTNSAKAVEKYEHEFRRFPGSFTRGDFFAALGISQEPKKELKVLSKQPALIVGTTERIIDHLRRNNLSFVAAPSIVANIPEKEGRQEFTHDVEFILTKIPQTGSISLFTPAISLVEELEYLLKRPITLTAEERNRTVPPYHIYESPEPSPRTLLELMYAKDISRSLVLVDTPQRAEKFRRFLERQGISCRTVDRTTVSPVTEHEKEMAESFRCSATAFQDAAHIGLHYDSLFLFGLPEKESLLLELAQAVSGHRPRPVLSLILSSREMDSFRTLQEKYQMNSKEEDFPKNEEVLQGQLKSLVKRIKEEENPDILNKYRRLIKKSVPLFMRGYLSAFLFKSMVEGDTPSLAASGDGEMQTIFVSIGKNRKVFPKDLARLFRSKVKLGPKDIGNIKVLDNYSFIDIPKDRAKEAIEAMDNIDFRGRTITVNFARKKRDKRDTGDNKTQSSSPSQ